MHNKPFTPFTPHYLFQVRSIIDDFLHSDLCSRQDNYRKRKHVLSLPPDGETGEVQYCIHWQRELRSNWKSLFVMLTGEDANGNPVEGLEPSSWWRQIITLTTTSKRPHGIQGSPALLSKWACPCLVAACISQCSCPHCTTFLENIDHRHLTFRGLGKRPSSVCIPEAETTEAAAETVSSACTACGGECTKAHDGPWRKMSEGLIPFTLNILCPAVEIPNVSVAAYDPTTGLEIPGSVIPVKIIQRKCWLGECTKCGWDQRFAKFPLLPLKIKEDDNSERQVFVRACPREAREDRWTTWHEFRMMERGHGEDGSTYNQPEWTPITGTRRMFYYQLTEFMKV